MRARFVLIFLRGGLDGLSAVVPSGDPHLATLRRPLVPDRTLYLDGFFRLHPALEFVHAAFGAGDALLLHAVGGPHRARSHFDAQDLMEFGAAQRQSSGWLNRVAGLLPPQEMPVAIGVGAQVPVMLRGPVRVGSWAPLGWDTPDPALRERILAIHAPDALTRPLLAGGLRDRAFVRDALRAMPMGGNPRDPKLLATALGRIMAAPDGPRIGTLDIEDWDTHAGQVPRLAGKLRELDEALAALSESLGDAWNETVVAVVTEFGRTVRVNGTGGTDHGTASAALLLGGAVDGGRVVADWPGLGKLFEDRDLAPATDIRAVMKAVLTDHLGLASRQLADVFPAGAGVAALRGMIA